VDNPRVVTLRDATDGDGPAWRDLVNNSIVYAGDGLLAQDKAPTAGFLPADGARLAEDDTGLVGTHRLLARRGSAGMEAELTIMLVARRAQDWAVERLLLLDAQQQAALRGAHEMTILARPPMDVFFRDMGACAIRIAGPSGGITWPRLQLVLPV
jgi:hypothetical protein